MKREDILERMAALHEQAVAEARHLTPDEQAEFERLEAEAHAFLKATPMEPTDVIEARPEPVRTRVLAAPAIHARPQTSSDALLRGAIALAAGSHGIDTGLAREVDAETRRRTPWNEAAGGVRLSMKALMVVQKAVGALAGGSAESTKGDQWLDGLFFRSDDAIVGPRLAAALGVNTVVGTEERVHISKLTGTVEAAWIARDADVPNTDASFDAIEITPKSIGANIMVKRSALLYSSHPAVEPILQTEMRDAVLNALDYAVIYGSGDAVTPQGIAGVAQAGGSLNGLVDAYRIRHLLAAYQKSDAGMRFLIPDEAEAKLATTAAFAGATVSTIANGTLAGYPYVVTTQAPVGTVVNTKQWIGGNFSYAHLVIWDSVTLLANPYGAGFASGSIELRVIADANVLVRDPKRLFVGNAAI